MRLLYIPIRDDRPFTYTFDGEVVVAEIEGKVDTFDLSPLREGDTLEGVETFLPVNPLAEAWREDGVIHLKLLYHHGKDATEEERFPEWEEV